MTFERIRMLVVVVLAALLSTAPLRAELSTETGNSGRVKTLLMAIVDHPDPVGSAAWQPFRELRSEQLLNPEGFLRGDGGPDMGASRETAQPVVVWAYNLIGDYDVAFAEWLGDAWTEKVFLTSTTQDEIDPRVAVGDDGTIFVAWWIAGSPSKILVSRRLGVESGWTLPVPVTTDGVSARRPSLLVDRGVLLVAYERDSSLDGMAQDVVVAEMTANGEFVHHLVASTPRTDRLDPILHSQQNRLWLDWKHGSREFGLAVAEGPEWNPWPLETWSDDTWIGVERLRMQIRKAVITP